MYFDNMQESKTFKTRIYVTRYGKIDHSQFFYEIAFWVSGFTVEFNGQRARLKEFPKPRYGQKIVRGSPVPQFTIFREMECFVRT